MGGQVLIRLSSRLFTQLQQILTVQDMSLPVFHKDAGPDISVLQIHGQRNEDRVFGGAAVMVQDLGQPGLSSAVFISIMQRFLSKLCN
ncbi:MAG: hypothetical protein LBP22_08235 [Deltaproteobacteria bacterium]|nr:hypothetical protein [Deltaproteobacteria bacterium]